MKRKALIAGIVAASLIAGFLGYGWWTRRGPIEFAKGGDFGVSEAGSPVPNASPSGQTTATASASPRASAARPTPGTTVKGTTQTTGPARERRAGSLAPPAPGSYVFRGSGREQVDFGPTSACAWDIDEVTMVAKRDGDLTVVDWTWSPNRQQRGIYEFGAKGMLHRYFGAAATCLGIRRTEEGDYSPPMVRLTSNLDPGSRWTATSRLPNWTERTEGSVLRRERVRVAAGTFDAVVVSLRTTFSDGQSGVFEGTFWYAPAVGLWVKERARTDVQASGADFTSDYQIELASYPR